MNKKIAQEIEVAEDGNNYIRYDWYPKAIPANLQLDGMVYLDSMYSFACFHSIQPNGFEMGYASGNYLHSHFLVGEQGKIKVGKYVILEATNILANESVTIGDHCMFSWGSYITDTWVDKSFFPLSVRKKILEKLAHSRYRYLELPETKPVIIEDNVWVGFDAVIMPGVRLGRGCVVGSKTVIWQDVPPYAVIVGEPARIVKYLEPNDTEEARKKAIELYQNH
jgi:acetyltransferase-like isoleucine patch superfamily enzyme